MWQVPEMQTETQNQESGSRPHILQPRELASPRRWGPARDVVPSDGGPALGWPLTAVQWRQAGPSPGSREGGTAERPGSVRMRHVPCTWPEMLAFRNSCATCERCTEEAGVKSRAFPPAAGLYQHRCVCLQPRNPVTWLPCMSQQV